MMDDEQRRVMVEHGYDPDLRPRGVGGGPERIKTGYEGQVHRWDGWPYLRNHVCELDGVAIDGHEMSDLDIVGPGSQCLHCDYVVPGEPW